MKVFKTLNKEIIIYGTTTIVIVEACDTLTGEVVKVKGIAKCNPTETYNKNVGVQIANIRAYRKVNKRFLNSYNLIQKMLIRKMDEIVVRANELQIMDRKGFAKLNDILVNLDYPDKN